MEVGYSAKDTEALYANGNRPLIYYIHYSCNLALRGLAIEVG
jgi:hypothetical protein